MIVNPNFPSKSVNILSLFNLLLSILFVRNTQDTLIQIFSLGVPKGGLSLAGMIQDTEPDIQTRLVDKHIVLISSIP